MKKTILIVSLLLVGSCGGEHSKSNIDGPTATPNVTRPPDVRCKNNVSDLSDPWIANGTWVGYIDGQLVMVTSTEAMTASLEGKDVQGIWLCPPKGE